MNTANLQLEGFYAVFAAILVALRDKQVFTRDELDALLSGVEQQLASDPQRPAEMRGSNIDAICFPARFLKQALQASSEGAGTSFAEIAGRVGKAKPLGRS